VAIEIKMPALAPSMTEGTLARWVKKEGDAVNAGEILAEVETDKAMVEFESPASGVLGKILVPNGTEGVKVDTLIAVLLQPGEAMPEMGKAASMAAPVPAAQPAVAAPANAAPAQTQVSGQRVFASPLARRIASENGLSLDGLHGSGPHGRIVRADVETALRAAPVAARSAPKPATVAVQTGAEYEDIPHSQVRRVIAQRLAEAKQQIPHFYLTVDCVLDSLLTLRAQINETRGEDKLSVNDFVVKGVALAMQRVPAVNASWTDTAIRRWRSVDVSVAVATPNGLITPIVRNADTKSLSVVSAEVKELAGRAREGRLKPAEFQGGGYTISNLGMFGIKEFAAIINPPQACILAVGAAEKRPIVREGALAVGTVMSCTLSVDHRVVDGAVGAEFLKAFKTLMENPLSILI